MGFDRVAEVEALLNQDERREGRLWRWYRDGRTDAEWQATNGVKTPPTNARHTIAALTFGVVPGGPSYAKVDAGVIRRWLDTKDMGTELRAVLTAQLRLLDKVAGGLGPAGTKQAFGRPAPVRSPGNHRHPGVYVYSLPIYLAHPVDAESGRTLLKVGHSAVDVFSRIASQSRTTALPEDPVHLRIYPCEHSSRMEAAFHDSLSQSGHRREGITSYAGKEWFLTSLEFLDAVAIGLGLEIEIIDHGGFNV
jgi:hypothetical protein